MTRDRGRGARSAAGCRGGSTGARSTPRRRTGWDFNRTTQARRRDTEQQVPRRGPRMLASWAASESGCATARGKQPERHTQARGPPAVGWKQRPRAAAKDWPGRKIGPRPVPRAPDRNCQPRRRSELGQVAEGQDAAAVVERSARLTREQESTAKVQELDQADHSLRRRRPPRGTPHPSGELVDLPRDH